MFVDKTTIQNIKDDNQNWLRIRRKSNQWLSKGFFYLGGKYFKSNVAVYHQQPPFEKLVYMVGRDYKLVSEVRNQAELKITVTDIFELTNHWLIFFKIAE